jgi:hypothetical protein
MPANGAYKNLGFCQILAGLYGLECLGVEIVVSFLDGHRALKILEFYESLAG